MLSWTSWDPYTFDGKHFHNLILQGMRTTQKVLEVFSSIVDHNRTQAPTLATSSIFAKTPLTAQANRVLEVVIYTAMPLLSLGPFPKAISQQWCLCFFFFSAHLMHLDSTVKVVGPLECLFQGAQPWLPRRPDFSPLPELHFKAMSAVLDGDQSSLYSTVIRIFSLCISLAG